MAPKLLGAALLVAGLVLRHQFARARRRGYVGPARRPITRDRQRARFRIALASRALGALICFVGAFLCLTGSLHRW